MQNRINVRDLILTAMFIAVGLVLPQVFHLFGGLGTIFLPMHIPVLLCGFVCGWKYGMICGIITPFLSSIITGMPVMFPIGISMIFELLTYGLLCGLLYNNLKLNVYVSLISAMLAGRVISGFAKMILMGVAGKPYSLTVFLTEAFVTALPGIIIQIILIPLLIISLSKAEKLKKV